MLFANVEEEINTELNRLDQALSSFDSTLAESLAKRRRKIVYHIAALRKKALLSSTRKDEVLDRQIETLFNAVLPNGNLQERSVNVFSMLNLYGMDFIDLVYKAIEPDSRTHQLLEI